MGKFFKHSNFINKNIKKISFLTFLLLFAFIGGNIFGIYLKKVDNFYTSILVTILALEIISFLNYSSQTKLSGLFTRFYEKESLNEKNLVLKYLNVLKRGFLIGLFVEAFKVGS